MATASARDIYKTIGGYVTGNLFISLIAGHRRAIVLLIVGSSYAVALGLVVASARPHPARRAPPSRRSSSPRWSSSSSAGCRALIVAVFFVVYQQLENHVLQPLIYGRTVQLSPLVVLIAVLIGAELAGILGALAAIPVAGFIQAIFREVVRWRRESIVVPGAEVALPDES